VARAWASGSSTSAAVTGANVSVPPALWIELTCAPIARWFPFSPSAGAKFTLVCRATSLALGYTS